MPMYSPPPRAERGAQQQMQAVGREAPQRGNYGGGTSRQRVPGQQAPGLSAALSGGQQRVPVGPYINRPGFSPRPAPQPAPQPAPRQVQNRAFASWNEPGSAYGQAPVQPAGATWNAPPVRMYPVDQTGGMDAMLDRRGVGAPSYTGGPVQATVLQPSYTGAPVEATVLQPRPNIRPIPSMAAQKTRSDGPQMMGPATGQMSLAGELTQHGQPRANTTATSYTASDESGSLDGGTPAGGGGGGFDPMKFLGLVASPEAIRGYAESAPEVLEDVFVNPARNAPEDLPSPSDGAGVAKKLGREAGRAAGAFPAGMAEALNEYTREDLENYYNNYEDIGGLKRAGESLLDPEQQAAADAAERAQMQAGINSQRDEQLRMLLGQRGRGGMVGSGAATGLLNSALRAQALGEQNLAQDQYQRMLGRNQLGGQLISDYGRQKYGLMNDAYASPGEIASLLLQATQAGAGILDKLPMNMAELTGLG